MSSRASGSPPFVVVYDSGTDAAGLTPAQRDQLSPAPALNPVQYVVTTARMAPN